MLRKLFTKLTIAISLLVSPVSITAASAWPWSHAPLNPIAWLFSHFDAAAQQQENTVAAIQGREPRDMVAEYISRRYVTRWQRNWMVNRRWGTAPVDNWRFNLLSDRDRGGIYANSRAAAIMTNAWMHPDVREAWRDGYMGQGTAITVYDDFESGDGDIFSYGKVFAPGDTLSEGWNKIADTHGEFVRDIASAVAPESYIRSYDWGSYPALTLVAGQLNIVNVSMRIPATAEQMRLVRAPGDSDLAFEQLPGSQQLAELARTGAAAVIASAGNDGIALDPDAADYENAGSALAAFVRDTKSFIFVSALERNGRALRCSWYFISKCDQRVDMAEYSTFAGDDPDIQERFLVVGVNSRGLGGLAGTSVAAPIVSGYAAIIGSKFTNATPEQVVRRLLDTARTDTIRDYDVAIHGQGEASLSRALAPQSIR